MSWAIHKMITKLPISTKLSRWWRSLWVTSTNSHLTTTSLMRRWMHTCYSLCTNEVCNLGLSNLNNLTRLLHSLVLKWLLQLNKWARELSWMSRSCIYRSSLQIQLLPSRTANFESSGRSGDTHQTCPGSSQWPMYDRLLEFLLCCTRCRPVFGL